MDQTLRKRVSREEADRIVAIFKAAPEYVPGPGQMQISTNLELIVDDLPNFVGDLK
jgi:hypothetical protein